MNGRGSTRLRPNQYPPFMRGSASADWKAASWAASLSAAGRGVGLVVFFTVRLAKAKDAALAEAARAQRVEKFMEDLFQGGDEEAGPAADLKVVTVIDRGVEKLPALNRDPEVQAHLYQTL